MYPPVLSEDETIGRMLDGGWFQGLARFGDGDFNIIRGARDRYHVPCPGLAQALAKNLRDGNPHVLNCLIPPPPSDSGLAHQRWCMYLEANAGIIPFLPASLYGSSNISRMDSCPSLHTTSWWRRVAQLWQDKDICLIRGSERSLTRDKMMDSPGAPRNVVEVICRAQNNFDQTDQIYEAVLGLKQETVILSAGLMSRPLVHRLVAHGLCAYDVGHFGLWFRNGDPIPLQDCPR